MDNFNVNQVFEYKAQVPVKGFEIFTEGRLNREDDSMGTLPYPLLSIRGGEMANVFYKSKEISIFDDHPSLYRKFIAMDLSPEGVLEFANEFGYLEGSKQTLFRRSGQMFSVTSFGPPSHERIPLSDNGWYMLYGQPLYQWYVDAEILRLAVLFWDLAQSNDEDALKTFVEWDGDCVAAYTIPFESKDENNLLAYIEEGSAPTALVLSELVDRNNITLSKVALALVQRFINDNLSGIDPVLTFNPDTLKFDLQIRPGCLIEALWLQFALAVNNRKGYKTCAHCGTWFEIGKYGSRRDRKFCGDACKQAAYDDRKRRQKA